MKVSKFDGCDFYAEVNRAGGVRGTVLIVSRTQFNGQCRKAVCTPKGKPDGVPMAEWIYPHYLNDPAKCVKVTEGDARRIQPQLFAACETWSKSAKYRETVYRVLRDMVLAGKPVQPVTEQNNVGGGFALDISNEEHKANLRRLGFSGESGN
jgi:hypothetical protein